LISFFNGSSQVEPAQPPLPAMLLMR
jgi:hypothetical protein